MMMMMMISDAGKSTMGGNILFLTGMVDKRTMDKIEKEAKDAGRETWYLSWALDTGTEERAKVRTRVLWKGRNKNTRSDFGFYRARPLNVVALTLKPPTAVIPFLMLQATRTTFLA